MYAHPFPGSEGEHRLQERLGSASRARAFYEKQMLDHLTPSMREFIAEREMFFLATADGRGECDCSFRAGERGLVQVLDEHTLVYPEYRGNGVYGSLGNITENPHVGLLFIDFFQDRVGLHVNGRARLHFPTDPAGQQAGDASPQAVPPGVGRRPELWVMVKVEEAYIHCSKHIPLLVKVPRPIDWGTDDPRKKGGDFFHAKHCDRPWASDQGTANVGTPLPAPPAPAAEPDGTSRVPSPPP